VGLNDGSIDQKFVWSILSGLLATCGATHLIGVVGDGCRLSGHGKAQSGPQRCDVKASRWRPPER
jgi:hypothetical protein